MISTVVLGKGGFVGFRSSTQPTELHLYSIKKPVIFLSEVLIKESNWPVDFGF